MNRAYLEWATKSSGRKHERTDPERLIGVQVKTPDGTGTIVKSSRVQVPPGSVAVTLDTQTGQDDPLVFRLSDLQVSDRTFGGAGIFKSPAALGLERRHGKKHEAEQTYTVEPGRNIFKDGEPFISISKEGSTSPTEADDITRELAAALNRPGPLA